MLCPGFNLTGRGFYDSFVLDPGQGTTPPAEMTEFYLELFTEDLPGVCIINGHPWSFARGRLLCSKPGQLRSTKLPARCYYIHLQTEDPGLLKLLNSLPDGHMLSDISDILHAFRRLAALSWARDTANVLRIQGAVSELLALIHTQIIREQEAAQRSPIDPRHQAILTETERYIRDNLSADLSLAHLAHRAKFSPSHFHTLFTSWFDMTPYAFVLSCRIQHAKAVLRSEQCDLVELASDCGFSSQSHFCAQFKKLTGQTPLQYRRSKISRIRL